MTAEQFLDAVWLVTGTAPAKADAIGSPAVRGDRAGAPVRPRGAGQVRRADAVARAARTASRWSRRAAMC